MAPSTSADRAALWLLSVAVVGVGGNLLATAITEEWRWVTYFAYATIALVVVVTLPGGFFHRSRYGPTILGRSVAGVTLAAYMAASALIASPNVLASIACIGLLWLASVLLTWNTLRAQVPINDAAVGVALLFAGSAFLIGGVSQAVTEGWIWRGWNGGVTYIWGRVGVAVLGIVSLVCAIAFLRGRYSLLGDVVGASGLLGGVASIPVASANLSSGVILLGIAGLLFGSASCLVGIASLFRLAAASEATVLGAAYLDYESGLILVGGMLLLCGIAVVWSGIVELRGNLDKYREAFSQRIRLILHRDGG